MVSKTYTVTTMLVSKVSKAKIQKPASRVGEKATTMSFLSKKKVMPTEFSISKNEFFLRKSKDNMIYPLCMYLNISYVYFR